MALTRKMLKAMGIEVEKIDQIIEAHGETVDALKADAETHKADAEKLPKVQKELDELKAKGDDGWKEKHDKVKKEFDDYKTGIETEKTKAAKNKAVREFFEGKGITGKNLEIAMRGSAAEIDGIELLDGKIKDSTALESLVSGDFSGLVVTTNTKGVNTQNPPAGNGGGGGSTKTKEQILAIKNGTERRKAIAENPSLFGISTEK